MFISKEEKSSLYRLIADLQLRVSELENKADAAPTPVDVETSKLLRQLEAAKLRANRESVNRNYWKKKAERIASGSTEGFRSKKSIEPAQAGGVNEHLL